MTIFDLDHVGIAIRDLDRAEAAYRRLGFALTERSYHMAKGPDGRPVRAGTGNHCFILRRGYVELIAPTDPGYSGRLLADLDRYEGLHLVALGTDSVDDATQLMGRPSGARISARRLTRPFSDRGQAFEAVFDILDLPEDAVTEAHVFAIKHLTPDVIWQKHLMVHPNGALDLRSVTFCVDDPVELANRLASSFSTKASAGTVELRAGSIVCLDPGAFAQRFGSMPPAMPSVGALSISVSDLDATASLLRTNGVAFKRDGTRLLVPPDAACGAIIEFTA